MTPDVQRSIFATNAFASQYPEEHTALWHQFEEAVPQQKRSGYYGADNAAYVKWLRETKQPLFLSFLQASIEGKQFGQP